jgi:hypothetical protein
MDGSVAVDRDGGTFADCFLMDYSTGEEYLPVACNTCLDSTALGQCMRHTHTYLGDGGLDIPGKGYVAHWDTEQQRKGDNMTTALRWTSMDLFKRLRDKVGWYDRIPDLWLLVPGPNQPPF